MICYAHLHAEEHDADLFAVLFEEGYSKYQSEEIKNSINAINWAANLCIDQYGGSRKANYERLKQLGMDGLPWNFSAIDYSIDFDSRNGMQISPNTHRKYTHQGCCCDVLFLLFGINKELLRKNIIIKPIGLCLQE